MAEMKKFVRHAKQNEEFHFIALGETKRNFIDPSEAVNSNCEAHLNSRQQQLQYTNFKSFNSTYFDCAWSICCGVTTIILVLLMCIWIVFEFREAHV